MGLELLHKEEFIQLSEIDQITYINNIVFDVNRRDAIIVHEDKCYNADNNEEINNIIEYAKNLQNYGCKLFA